MKWFLTSAAAVGSARRPAPGSPACRETTETIRAALMAALEGIGSPDTRVLLQRIQYAGDAERLWYLRPEAMSVLAGRHGEVHAREALARISAMFRDVLPDGLAAQLRAVGTAPCAGPMRRAHLKETA